MMRMAWLVAAALAIAAVAPGAAQDLSGIASARLRVVDMTYALNAHSPTWPGDEHAFEAHTVATPAKDGYFARSIFLLEHFGTHMDAPAHFPGGKLFLDQLPVTHFFAPAVVLDVTAEVAKSSDYRLTPARIAQWEAAHGRIPRGAIAVLRTGWGARWPDQARYRNTDAHGVMHFPGYSVAAARVLMERGVVGLGIDTLSIDYGPSQKFEVHQMDLPAGLFNLENLANVSQLPEAGAFLIAAPIKLEGGSGGPCRVFGLVRQ